MFYNVKIIWNLKTWILTPTLGFCLHYSPISRTLNIRIGHFENGCHRPLIPIYLPYLDSVALTSKTKIQRLNSSLYYSPRCGTLEIHGGHFENGCHNPLQTNLIATFGFHDPENIDIETIINFISILFAEIGDIGNSWWPF